MTKESRGEQYFPEGLIVDIETFWAREPDPTYVQKKLYEPRDLFPDEREGLFELASCYTGKSLYCDSKYGAIIFVELDFYFLAPPCSYAENNLAILVHEFLPVRRIEDLRCDPESAGDAACLSRKAFTNVNLLRKFIAVILLLVHHTYPRCTPKDSAEWLPTPRSGGLVPPKISVWYVGLISPHGRACAARVCRSSPVCN